MPILIWEEKKKPKKRNKTKPKTQKLLSSELLPNVIKTVRPLDGWRTQVFYLKSSCTSYSDAILWAAADSINGFSLGTAVHLTVAKAVISRTSWTPLSFVSALLPEQPLTLDVSKYPWQQINMAISSLPAQSALLLCYIHSPWPPLWF